MKPLRVNEIFYSIQGEGERAGEPSLFVRLSGCDQTCGFCDTEFESGKEMEPHALKQALEALNKDCRWIIWTGGEPALQLTDAIVELFHTWGFRQAIESNGNHRVPGALDWVAISPKVAEHVLAKNFPSGVDELRYVRHSGQLAVPEPRIKAKHYYLSPMFKGNMPDRDNIKHCLRLCLENPPWRLSVQTHKLLQVL